MSTATLRRCECGNEIDADSHLPLCDFCDYAASEPPHQGHRLLVTGAWYCDTCDSTYCELA